jgi:hypothetical protein
MTTRTPEELRRVTDPSGRQVVTVPACPTLWSARDEMMLHHRRHARRSMADAATG